MNQNHPQNYIMTFMGFDGELYTLAVTYEEGGCAILVTADEEGYYVVWEGAPDEANAVLEFMTKGTENATE